MRRKLEDIHSGSSFDDFLEEEGIYDEVVSAAAKRVIAWQLEQEMARQQITKQAMATELKTSRSQLDRLLDPRNTAVSIDALARAAHVLGKQLVFEMRDCAPQKPRQPARKKATARARVTRKTAAPPTRKTSRA
jgi:hypothetical protein